MNGFLASLASSRFSALRQQRHAEHKHAEARGNECVHWPSSVANTATDYTPPLAAKRSEYHYRCASQQDAVHQHLATAVNNNRAAEPSRPGVGDNSRALPMHNWRRCAGVPEWRQSFVDCAGRRRRQVLQAVSACW